MKKARSRPSLPISCIILLCCFFPGIFSSRIVTLESIQIYTAHEWLPAKPTVYFQCHGDKITILPDVKETHSLYTFKGEESWQPLTELPDKKCKRCGLYEKDSIKSDDVFDEWEFCPDDFVNGNYIHFKEDEFNATFACPECARPEDGSFSSSKSQAGAADHKMSVALVIVISTLVSTVVITGLVVGYKYWQKKKREEEQLQFLKLFEEGDDDIEEELGLGNVI